MSIEPLECLLIRKIHLQPTYCKRREVEPAPMSYYEQEHHTHLT